METLQYAPAEALNGRGNGHILIPHVTDSTRSEIVADVALGIQEHMPDVFHLFERSPESAGIHNGTTGRVSDKILQAEMERGSFVPMGNASLLVARELIPMGVAEIRFE